MLPALTKSWGRDETIPIPVSWRGFQVFWEVRDVGLFNATTLGLCRCVKEWLVG